MTFYEQDNSYRAWFEYAEPGLLTNRTIRNFLGSYKTDSWPDVVKLTLLYGIVTLKKAVDSEEPVPMDKLRQMVRQIEAADCIQDKLPPIQEKMASLKGDVQEILDAFETKSQKEKHKPPPVLQTPKIAEKPPTGIYPEWWGDGHEEIDDPKPVEKAAPIDRPQPRLCYSVPKQIATDIDRDDIVEPKYQMHKFKRSMAESSKKPRPVLNQSVSEITDSFLRNEWMSSICQLPPEPDPAYYYRSDRSRRELQIETSRSRSIKENPLSRSRVDSAFWVDLNEESVSEKSYSPRTRNCGGCVLDFGHLDSPNFPPKGFCSLSETSSGDLKEFLTFSTKSRTTSFSVSSEDEDCR